MKKIKSKSIILAILILIIGSIMWKYLLGNPKQVTYAFEQVKYGDIVQQVTANGTLNPVTLVKVGTEVSGKVQKIYADFNDQVTAGQVLLELDTKILKATVEQSLAQVQKATAVLDLAIANEKRGKTLYLQKYISAQDWEQLVATRKSAQADLSLANAQLQRNKTDLSNATIISPISGVVVKRDVDVGQTVAASFQTPELFEIAQDLSKMQIDSSYAEADIANIRAGQEVTFTVDAFPERVFNGKVKQIRLNPTTQQNVVTYDVVVVVDNPDGVLLPGMTAYVNIKTAEHKKVLIVPNAAFRFRPKDQVVKGGVGKEAFSAGLIYKQVDAKLEPVQCRLGITDNKYTEILAGNIRAGDSVVIGEAQQNAASSSSSFRLRVF
jgi:HlyD family secretion protein